METSLEDSEVPRDQTLARSKAAQRAGASRTGAVRLSKQVVAERSDDPAAGESAETACSRTRFAGERSHFVLAPRAAALASGELLRRSARSAAAPPGPAGRGARQRSSRYRAPRYRETAGGGRRHAHVAPLVCSLRSQRQRTRAALAYSLRSQRCGLLPVQHPHEGSQAPGAIVSVTDEELAALRAALGQALEQTPEREPEQLEAESSEAEDESAPGRRKKGIAPKLVPGDLTALRLLASWRFASPGALAAISWPLRSGAGQEWRMRRFVDCEWLGRRRLRYATTRHVVWGRPPATRVLLGAAPPPLPSVGLTAALEQWRPLRNDPKVAPHVDAAKLAIRESEGVASPAALAVALEATVANITVAADKGDKPVERRLRLRLLALDELAAELPAPEPALVPPRWSEHVARQGWMRSVVAAAYIKAGWQYAPAGIDSAPLRSLKTPGNFGIDAFRERVFQPGALPYPYDLALKIRSDGKELLHILVVDDLQAAIDRQLFRLPLEESTYRSPRLAVRFFPIDDATIWSDAERRHIFESPRAAALRVNLQVAGLWDSKGHELPAVAPWAAHASTWVPA